MLNIKRKGFFYKWLNFSSASFTYRLNDNRVTLCSLFWHSVWYFLSQIGVAAIAVLFSLGTGSILSTFLGLTFELGITPWYMIVGLSLAGLSTIVAILLAIAGIGWACAKIGDRVQEWNASKSFERAQKEYNARDEELRFGNIYQKMRIYKKDKLCPLIRVDHGE